MPPSPRSPIRPAGLLERAGLVSRRRDAQRRLEAQALRYATEWLDGYRQFWAEGFDRLDSPKEAPVSEIADRYRRRADTFEAKVANVAPDGWAAPSPCDEWTARDVVGHIVDMHGMMLRPLGRSLSPAPSIDEDPLGTFRAARADIETLLEDPGRAARECETPMGRMTIERHIDGVVSEDMVLHGWDLARATGQDDTIDSAEIDRLWPGVQDMPAEMRIPGAFGPGIVVFGPEVEVPANAPLQDRILGLLGRDPHWRSNSAPS